MGINTTKNRKEREKVPGEKRCPGAVIDDGESVESILSNPSMGRAF
jgi:hypothetical protein